jgi:hypothetical protein
MRIYFYQHGLQSEHDDCINLQEGCTNAAKVNNPLVLFVAIPRHSVRGEGSSNILGIHLSCQLAKALDSYAGLTRLRRSASAFRRHEHTWHASSAFA